MKESGFAAVAKAINECIAVNHTEWIYRKFQQRVNDTKTTEDNYLLYPLLTDTAARLVENMKLNLERFYVIIRQWIK